MFSNAFCLICRNCGAVFVSVKALRTGRQISLYVNFSHSIDFGLEVYQDCLVRRRMTVGSFHQFGHFS